MPPILPDPADDAIVEVDHRPAIQRIVADLNTRYRRNLSVKWERYGAGSLVEPVGDSPPRESFGSGPLADILASISRPKEKILSDVIPPVSLLRFLEGFAAGMAYRG